MWELDIGATDADPGMVRFRVWAPFAKRVSVRVLSRRRVERLMGNPEGYFEGAVEGLHASEQYLYLVDGTERYSL